MDGSHAWSHLFGLLSIRSTKVCVYFFKIRLGLKILAPSRKVLEREIFQSGVGAPVLTFCYLICELRSIFWLGIIWNLEKEIKSDFGVGLAWSWYNCKQFNFNIKPFCCIMFSTKVSFAHKYRLIFFKFGEWDSNPAPFEKSCSLESTVRWKLSLCSKIIFFLEKAN